jgi:DNA invertase Pin-like site-specific DNA recombinase
MKIGYVRVSTEEQNEARQLKMMEEQQVEKIFTDKQSGKNTDRPAFKEMMEFVRSGDILIVESYSRLARSTRDLLNIVDDLEQKGVKFISLKENVDTTSPQGKLIFSIFASLAEFERAQILQRQKEGIAIAKANGKYKGRKAIILDEKILNDVYLKWNNGEITARKAMELLDVKPNTFYRRVKELNKALE